MYAIVVGGGKVGLNLTRELMQKGNEVTLIENSRRRYTILEPQLEHVVQLGDGTELWVLERAGIERADMVIAVTGDDEDNIIISQVAREKYGRDKIISRCNNIRNMEHFDLLDIKPVGQLDRPDSAPDRARGPAVRTRPPAQAAGRRPRDHRGRGQRRLVGGRQDGRARSNLPDGGLLIAILREGAGIRAARRHRDRTPATRSCWCSTRASKRASRNSSTRPKRLSRSVPAVADRHVAHLLIGGGLASANCARWLREAGGDDAGEILIVGREPEPPYYRPSLTKGYLAAHRGPRDGVLPPARVLGREQHRGHDARPT